MDIHGFVDLLAPSVRPLGALDSLNELKIFSAISETRAGLKENDRCLAGMVSIEPVSNTPRKP